ncbi:MAG TPA: hypothetical protein VF678_16430 [bacterium]
MRPTTLKQWSLVAVAALLVATTGCAPSSTASGSNNGGGGGSGGEGSSSSPFTLTGPHTGASVGAGGTSYYFASQTGNPLDAQTTNNSANIQVLMYDGSFGGTNVCDNTTKNPNDIMDCQGTVSTSAYIIVNDVDGTGSSFDIDVFAP